MKNLLIAIALVVLLGIGGFWYRYSIEHPHGTAVSRNATPPPAAQACTDEAMVCPDGSAVGRTGPNCSFAPCAFPNASVPIASSTLTFLVPTGYQVATVGAAPAPSDVAPRASYQKASASGFHRIRIYEYAIPTGATAQSVLLSHTVLSPSGLQATSTNAFSTVVIAGRSFSVITTERFEGQVVTSYYWIRANDVVRFELTEQDVSNWTDPKLNTASLPEHQSLIQMLATLQSAGQ
jgi:hypothetical protein